MFRALQVAPSWRTGGINRFTKACVAGRQDAEDYSSNYVERDERRLAELGRRAVEMYAVAHIFAELESAYSEAESIKRQDALIREVRRRRAVLLRCCSLSLARQVRSRVPAHLVPISGPTKTC